MAEQLYKETPAPAALPATVPPAGGCPLREVLDRVGDKWSVLVVLELKEGRQRFNQLKRRIEGISQRMLTETLRQLERDGLVYRTVFAGQPLRVEYRLTDLGRTLLEPITALAAWAEQSRPKITAARRLYDRQRSHCSVSEG